MVGEDPTGTGESSNVIESFVEEGLTLRKASGQRKSQESVRVFHVVGFDHKDGQMSDPAKGGRSNL